MSKSLRLSSAPFLVGHSFPIFLSAATCLFSPAEDSVRSFFPQQKKGLQNPVSKEKRNGISFL